MTIENIINNIKNEYLRLLDGNLENYTIEPALEDAVTVLSSKFDIVLPTDFIWFLTKSGLKIAIENAYDTIDIEAIDYKLEKMNKWLDEGAFEGKIEHIDGDPSPLMQNVWWNKKWVPFAEDGGGNLLCIDLDPGEQGVSGQIIGFERGSGPYPTEFKSFGEFLNYQFEFTKNGGLQGSSDGTLS
jgi:cell wall assembly regulator SMI1